MIWLQEFSLTIAILLLSLLLTCVGYISGVFKTSRSSLSYEKLSSYECGFDAFSSAREPFDVKFYLIAILFIIFDVEVIFFFPWVLSLKHLFFEGFFSMLVFFHILMIGYGYEWKKGCIDWN